MSNASDYADSLASGIKALTNAGAPFGWTDEDGENWTDTQPESHEPDDTGLREASAADYLTDVLDVQYIVNSDRQYISARVCIAFGGPTAWINTHTRQLEVNWWSETEYRDLPIDFIEGIDEFLDELWEMGK